MSDQADLRDLLARVEAATGPDREIDRAIWRHFNPIKLERRVSDVQLPEGFGKGPLNDALDPTPMLTSSVDAALALVERKLPGRGIVMGLGKNSPDEPIAGAAIIFNGLHPDSGDAGEAEVATLPIAVLSALLRALIHQGHTT